MGRRWVRRHTGLLPVRRVRRSGLAPSEPRRSRMLERQRLAALDLVASHSGHIRTAARRYRVPAEAIVGAILFHALENPYRRPFLRLGPGGVHPFELTRPSDAELAERAGFVPSPPGGPRERLRRLREPESAIVYIAAILAYHTRNYMTIAGVDISDDPAVLCTLYQGGKSEKRARRLAERRGSGLDARPLPGDEMAPWVVGNLDFVSAALEGEPQTQTAYGLSGRLEPAPAAP